MSKLSVVRCFAVVLCCAIAVLSSSAFAANWDCRENQNVKGIDLYGGQYTIEGSLEMCKAKCVGICEFIVYNSLQQCYQKRSWDNGPAGITGPELGTTACRKT